MQYGCASLVLTRNPGSPARDQAACFGGLFFLNRNDGRQFLSSEGFVEGQHAGLAHALERSPVEGVLARQLSGGIDLDMAHAKVVRSAARAAALALRLA